MQKQGGHSAAKPVKTEMNDVGKEAVKALDLFILWIIVYKSWITVYMSPANFDHSAFL